MESILPKSCGLKKKKKKMYKKLAFLQGVVPKSTFSLSPKRD